MSTFTGRPALTITERLADFIVGLRYEDIPEPVVGRAKDLLVHHLGLAVLGHASPQALAAVRVAHELSGPGGRCTIVGDPTPADLLDAVLANSVLIIHDGRDDVEEPSGVHPGAIVQPVAWAAGEAAAASGRELLVAIVVGYEVMTRLCGSVNTMDLHVPRLPNAVVGPFGGAATAARLMGLSHQQTVDALGHAGQLSMGTLEGSEFLTLYPRLARNGATAAVLASLDVPGVETIVEGDYGTYRSFFFQDAPDDLTAGLDSPTPHFAMERAMTKRRRASMLNMVALELTQQLIDEQDLRSAAVKHVHVVLPVERRRREEAYELFDGPAGLGPASLRFRIANILVDGGIDTDRYLLPPDEEVRSLCGRIRLSYEPGRSSQYARITVTDVDGHTYTAEGDTYVPPPTTWNQWLSETSRDQLSADRLVMVEDTVRDLENVTVPDLMGLFR